MTETEFQIGRVVLAKAGREKGAAFLIIRRLDDEYVLIADGRSRTVSKPKKKKTKHLTPKPILIRELKSKLEAGELVLDADIRKTLESFGL